MRRVGVLLLFADDASSRSYLAAFQRRLQDLGWIEGQNVLLDHRFAAGDTERLRTYAAELVNLRPDIITCAGAIPLAVLRQQTQSIPLVFAAVTDPVGGGFIDSLAHPGGNITGFTNFQYAMVEKWLQLLREIAPSSRRVGLFQNPQNADWLGYLGAAKAAAASLGAELVPSPVSSVAEIERDISALARESNGGIVALPDAFLISNRDLLVALAGRHRLPAIYPFRQFSSSGGLISYGPDMADLFRGAASYVDRILKGDKPADLPVQAPTKFELVVNLKTAKALGLAIPQSVLLRADEVIE
jgi:putative tryptophan/tyrosine transport system substrate-binding protein